jgi:uncharacterized membrane protein YeaQ/YmgE (transglycosylase-associated protein family)
LVYQGGPQSKAPQLCHPPPPSLEAKLGLAPDGKRDDRRTPGRRATDPLAWPAPHLGAAGEGGRTMTLQLIMMWVLVGLSAGWLSRYLIKDGGYGLIGDLVLGLVGSVVASLLFRALGISPGAALIGGVIVASAGAVLVILAQRVLWQAHA